MIPAVSTGQDITEILALILIYFLVITFILFIFHAIVAYLVYRDADAHGMSGGLWALFVIILPAIFFLLGLIVYIIAVLVVAIAYAIQRSQAGGFHKTCAKRSGGECVKWKRG